MTSTRRRRRRLPNVRRLPFALLPLVVAPLVLGACERSKDAAPAAAQKEEESQDPASSAPPGADAMRGDGEAPSALEPEAAAPVEMDEAKPSGRRERKREIEGGLGSGAQRGAGIGEPSGYGGLAAPSRRDKGAMAQRAKPAPPADDAEDASTAIAPMFDGAGRPTNMFFRHYGVNPTVDTAELRQSTFSIDVDTASYTMARSYLSRGMLPDEAAIRVEELVNAFDYGYAPPTEGPFTVHAEAAPSRNRRGYHVLHVGVQGKEVAKAERKPAHLAFVIDVSGSMDQENRLGLVQRSLRLLVAELDERDTVGIVTYGSQARVALPAMRADKKAEILAVIDGLKIEGATNAEAGLRLGYQLAGQQFRSDHVNRVILCSDGVANVGRTGPDSLVSHIIKESKRGITLSAVGFGMGNYNDTMMEQLANKGEGNYHYVDQLSEARRVFVEDLTGTLQVIAKDVKVQVDFDPTVVQRYRLIGYENRALKTQDFDDDRVDAGEIGAGHSVTAIYEVRLAANAPADRALGKVRLRYKAPTGGRSALLEKPLAARIVRGDRADLSGPTKLSLGVAQFAEKLRGSYWARNLSYADILESLQALPPSLRQRKDVAELIGLVRKASDIDQRGDTFAAKYGPVAQMDFDRVPVLQ
ncbi:MAG: von Willebrand factor type A domain-containing protein [Myxococcota bacterium]